MQFFMLWNASEITKTGSEMLLSLFHLDNNFCGCKQRSSINSSSGTNVVLLIESERDNSIRKSSISVRLQQRNKEASFKKASRSENLNANFSSLDNETFFSLRCYLPKDYSNESVGKFLVLQFEDDAVSVTDKSYNSNNSSEPKHNNRQSP